MDKKYFQKVFSDERMQKYFDIHSPDENLSIKHYNINIQISESFYPVLSIFEIALRNSINRELITLFNTTDWYLKLQTISGLKNLNKEITRAQRLIAGRGETINANKLIAELTLGFWIRLFNAEYEFVLWKDLRRAFPYCLKRDKQRHKISAPLNKIRNLRNRIYHNEPIAWNLKLLDGYHYDIYRVLGWLNKDLPNYTKQLDRFDEVLSNSKRELGI